MNDPASRQHSTRAANPSADPTGRLNGGPPAGIGERRTALNRDLTDGPTAPTGMSGARRPRGPIGGIDRANPPVAAWTGAVLLLVLLGLPGWLLRATAVQRIESRFAARLAETDRHLTAHSAVARAFAPGQSLPGVLPRWAPDPAGLGAISADLDRAAPQAFLWLAWNREGRLLELPGRRTAPGRRLWQPLVTYLHATGGAPARPGAAAGSPTIGLERNLQHLLGRDLELPRLVSARHRPVYFAWLDRPAVVVWTTWPVAAPVPGPTANRPDRTNLDPASHSVGGCLVIARLDRTDPWFWARLAMDQATPRSGRFRLAALIPGQRARCRLGPGWPPLPGLPRRILDAYEHRQSLVWRHDGHLVRELPVEFAGPIRAVIATDIQSLEADRELRRRAIDALTGIAALLLLLLWAGGGETTLAGGSLRFRLAGAFALAVLPPAMTVLAWSPDAIAATRNRFETMRDRAFAEAQQDLSDRYATFFDRQGTRIFRWLARQARGGRGHAHLRQMLERLRRGGWIAGYTVSDDQGREIFAVPAPDENPTRAGVRRTRSQIELRDQVGPNPAAIEWTQVASEPGRITLLRPTGIHRFRLFARWWLSQDLLAVIDGRPFLVWMDLTQTDLDRSFARLEIDRWQRGDSARLPASDDRPRLEAIIARNLRWHLTATTAAGAGDAAPFWRRHALIALALRGGFALDTTVDLAGQPWFVHISPSCADLPFRSIWRLPAAATVRREHQQGRHLVETISGALLIALMLGWTIAARLLVPIRRLAAGLAAVTSGDLAGAGRLQGDGAVPDDEFGPMIVSFTRMVHALAERQRLAAYVSPTVLEAVRDDRPRAGRGGTSPAAAGTELEATVLFADLQGFTRWSRGRPAVEIMACLDRAFRHWTAAIDTHGGRIDKFIGDAMMALFLQPGADGASRAARAALAIAGQPAAGLELRTTVGISTARVLLGDIGSERRKDLTAIGDGVNLAARLQVAATGCPRTGIVLSANTRALLGEQARAELLPQTVVKGKADPVQMYELLEWMSAEAPEG